MICVSVSGKLGEHLTVDQTLEVKTPQDGADMKVNRKVKQKRKCLVFFSSTQSVSPAANLRAVLLFKFISRH